MKQNSFFSLIAIFLFTASTGLFAQTLGAGSDGAPSKGGLMAGHTYQFAASGVGTSPFEGEIYIDTDQAKPDQPIGKGTFNGCEGEIYLGGGATSLAEAKSLIFVPSGDDRKCTKVEIMIADDPKMAGVQIKVSGKGATLSQVD